MGAEGSSLRRLARRKLLVLLLALLVAFGCIIWLERLRFFIREVSLNSSQWSQRFLDVQIAIGLEAIAI